ncbi:hypothetical protein QTA56_15170 [Acinetobacter sp. VNH17]|uniref:SGNH/GDSL hydrolase family protein n=1 Tax=Acinetobacter thutiue TaxID=2998078 RepID=A0ABT7WS94_9GAMM|nr:hypothetical protein [Acinetobacter thutiue]MCY6413453.1 hypothetical protein [Acinetobacter thutiue]MDN0015562.1 hypothetical protein [Acinetobacter thutiue]
MFIDDFTIVIGMGFQMKKILILGFSVTADKKGYATFIKSRLESEQIAEVDVIGLGGIHPIDLVYLYNSIVIKEYDFIVLDVSTSAFRDFVKDKKDITFTFFALAAKTLLHGALPLFINLWKEDVDAVKDFSLKAIDRLGKQMGFPVINIAKLIKKQDHALFFKDVVHPTEKGTDFYVDKVYKFLLEHMNDRIFTQNLDFKRLNLVSNLYSIPAEKLISGKNKQNFQRSGLSCEIVQIESKDGVVRLDYDVGHPLVRVAGLAGPRTSGLWVYDGTGKQYLSFYDEYCYYDRLLVRRLSRLGHGTLSVLLDTEIPNIKLQKGDKNEGPRLGGIGYFCFEKTPMAELIRKYK